MEDQALHGELSRRITEFPNTTFDEDDDQDETESDETESDETESNESEGKHIELSMKRHQFLWMTRWAIT